MAIEDKKGVAKAGPRAVVLASYGYLLFHEKEFAKKQWNGLVLDEAQAIKNESAKRTKAVKGFVPQQRNVDGTSQRGDRHQIKKRILMS